MCGAWRSGRRPKIVCARSCPKRALDCQPENGRIGLQPAWRGALQIKGPFTRKGPDLLAEWTGLEPATPGVTGRYSNQLNYHSMRLSRRFSGLRKCHNNLMPLKNCIDNPQILYSGRFLVDLRSISGQSEATASSRRSYFAQPKTLAQTDRPSRRRQSLRRKTQARLNRSLSARVRCASRAVPRSPEHHPHITHTSLKRPGWARCATRIAGVPQVRTFFGAVRAKDATVSHLRTRLFLHVDRIRGM